MSRVSAWMRQHPRLIIFGAMAVLAAWGITSRTLAARDVAKATEAGTIPVVAVMTPTLSDKPIDLMLPGNLRAYYDAPIYARTSGYLKSWLVDIGAQVKTGQLLAIIESPEVDQQLMQAEADLAQAKANENLADTTAKRYLDLLKTDSVSRQDTDERVSNDQAAKAAREAAEANVGRLKQLQSFEQVTAPFDGVITERNTDIGALINAGSAQGQQLFRMAATGKLWIYVAVPETYAREMTADLPAYVSVAEHPGEKFSAKITSTADAVDPTSRTLLVQLAVDNSNNELFAGAYGEVHFGLPPNKDSVRIPVNALLFRNDGMTVATVDNDMHILIKPIKIGRDYGNEVEVTAGLAAGDRIVINVPDAIRNGQTVKLAKDSGEEKKHD